MVKLIELIRNRIEVYMKKEKKMKKKITSLKILKLKERVKEEEKKLNKFRQKISTTVNIWIKINFILHEDIETKNNIVGISLMYRKYIDLSHSEYEHKLLSELISSETPKNICKYYKCKKRKVKK